MRNDLSADSGVLNISRDVAASDRASCFSQRLVSSGVVGIVSRVDEVTNRTFRERANCGQDLVGQRSVLGINDQDAVISNLDRDVATRANEHVDMALDRQNMNLDGIQVLVLLCPTKTRKQKNKKSGGESLTHFLIFA